MKGRLSFILIIILLLVASGFIILKNLQNKSIFYFNGKSYKEENGENICLNHQSIFENISKEIDIESDSKNEKFIIKNNIIYIYQKNEIIWQSSPKWKVENLILEDINNDKTMDIIFSLWKFGKYGANLPFWLKENTKEWGNHLFIYGWQDGKIKPVWCSSTIDAPIKEMRAGDINGDGRNELIILEGNYNWPNNPWAEYVTVWSWNGWGFSNEYRSKKGRFCNLTLSDVDKNNILEICVTKIRGTLP